MPATDAPAGSGLVARIIDFCGRKRFFVFLVAAALVAWGAFSARRAPLDALPDLSDTQVIVATGWMGVSPTLIENQVTYPISTSFLGGTNWLLRFGRGCSDSAASCCRAV